MRDSSGGVVVLAIIVVFITFVSAYMAFNVNYTKAFRMKNKIIDTIEKYDGKCGAKSSCRNEITKYSKDIGYNPYNIKSCPKIDGSKRVSGVEIVDKKYCMYEFKVVSDGNAYCIKKNAGGTCIQTDTGNRYYYRIMTVIDIKIPVIQNILGLNLMSVTGDTKYFKK